MVERLENLGLIFISPRCRLIRHVFPTKKHPEGSGTFERIRKRRDPDPLEPPSSVSQAVGGCRQMTGTSPNILNPAGRSPPELTRAPVFSRSFWWFLGDLVDLRHTAGQMGLVPASTDPPCPKCPSLRRGYSLDVTRTPLCGPWGRFPLLSYTSSC